VLHHRGVAGGDGTIVGHVVGTRSVGRGVVGRIVEVGA
jgi:hypothetical protein